MNLNNMINPRDFNGEVMMNLILKHYPHKVNYPKYRQLLMEKYENQLIKLTNIE